MDVSVTSVTEVTKSLRILCDLSLRDELRKLLRQLSGRQPN